MNIGLRNRPKYICDRCENEIEGYHKNSKNHKAPNKYYKIKKGEYIPTKDFDLCDNCEKEFREWLKTKPIPKRICADTIIEEFEIYKGE